MFQIWDMDIKDIAVGITRIGSDTYQWPMDTPSSAFNISHNTSEKLSVWHSRMGHLNLATLRKYLTRLKVNFLDDVSENFVYGPCELSKATKQYNRLPRPLLKVKYTEIHTDLVGPITPQGFSREKYFFTFTDRATRETKTSTGREKSEWFSHLKTYYAQAQTMSQTERPI